MKSRFLILFTAVIAFISLQSASIADSIALVIDDSIVTKGEWDSAYQQARAEVAYIPAQHRPNQEELVENVINYLALGKIQKKIVDQIGVEVSDHAVDSAIADIARRNGATVEQLRGYLGSQGLSWESYRNEIRAQMLSSQLQSEIMQGVSITEDEVDLYMRSAEFQKIKAEIQKRNQTQIDVSHILIRVSKDTTDAQAQTVIQRLYDRIQNGESFEEIAHAQSEDPMSAAQQGRVGWVTQGQMDPQFDRVMTTLDIGVVSQPVKTAFGYHIIRVNERKQGVADDQMLRSLAQENYYRKKGAQAYSLWQEKMLSDVYIERRF